MKCSWVDLPALLPPMPSLAAEWAKGAYLKKSLGRSSADCAPLLNLRGIDTDRMDGQNTKVPYSHAVLFPSYRQAHQSCREKTVFLTADKQDLPAGTSVVPHMGRGVLCTSCAP